MSEPTGWPTHRPAPVTERLTAARDLDAAAVLRGAANYLETNGWLPGPGNGTDKATCALIAIGHAAMSVPNLAAYTAAHSALCNVVAWPSVIEWNDTPGRTADEVLTALRAAADVLDPPA